MGFKTINERGADKARLLHWLIQPKQGVSSKLAELGINVLEMALEKGENPHKTCEQFKEGYTKIANDPKFPESFWIDNYVLYWCRATERILINRGVNSAKDIISIDKASKRKPLILLAILNALVIFELVTKLWIL